MTLEPERTKNATNNKSSETEIATKHSGRQWISSRDG